MKYIEPNHLSPVLPTGGKTALLIKQHAQLFIIHFILFYLSVLMAEEVVKAMSPHKKRIE